MKCVMIFAILSAAVATPALGTVTINTAGRVIQTTDAADTSNSPLSSSVNTTSGFFIDSRSDTAGADNTFTSGSASQNSNLLPLKWGGSGTADTITHTGSPNTSASISMIYITFTIDTPYQWSTEGVLTTSTDGGFAGAYMVLEKTGLGTVFNKSSNIVDTGIINAGSYWLIIEAHSDAANGSNSSDHAAFTDTYFSLAQAPEPASLSVLAIGAAGLLMRRRK